MTKPRIAGITFLVLAAAFSLFLLSSASSLPPTVASHFDIHGRPNAWMRSSSYLALFAAIGLGSALLIVAAFYIVRWLPPGLINIPRRDFWLSRDRSAETCRYLFTQGLWFACMILAFMLAIHYLVVRANRSAPPHLSSEAIFLLMAIFFVALVLWIVNFLRCFNRLPAH